jgi:hypothetical protein
MPDDVRENSAKPQQTAAAKICKRLLSQAQERRKRFETSGREIMRYGYSPDYNFEYQNSNPQAWFKAKYAKTAEAFGVMTPRLMPPGEPNRLITPTSQDPGLVARTEARQFYLNYAPRYTRWSYHRRKATEEALGYGRGVMWTSLDERTGLICSKWNPIEDLWDDPNALTCDDRSLIIRRRIIPRYEAIEEYPNAADALRKLPQAKKDTGLDRLHQVPNTDDTICFYEYWFLNGLGGYKGSEEIVKEIAKANKVQMSDDDAKKLSQNQGTNPIKYLITEDGAYIYECPWPIPFHLMVRDPWPCTFMDLVDNPQSIYPVSPLEPGIGIQRALNHLVTLAMGKMRHCMKVMYAIKKQNRSGLSKEDVRRVIAGSDIEKIEVEFNGTTGKLSDFIEQFNWDMGWVTATQGFLAMLESIYERLTGLYSWLHSGQGSTQDRSAQATMARERNTMARIEDMRDTCREFDGILASKECFAACNILKPDALAKVLPPNLVQSWGTMVRAEVINPQALGQIALSQGITDPNEQQAFVSNLMSRFYSVDEIVYQSLFEIEAASSRRKDIDQQIDLMKEKLNTVVPVQIQSPDLNERAIGYETLALDAKLEGLPNDMQDYYRQQADMYRQLGQAQIQLQQIQMQQQLMMAQSQTQMMQQQMAAGIPPGSPPPGQAPAQPQPQPQAQGVPA